MRPGAPLVAQSVETLEAVVVQAVVVQVVVDQVVVVQAVVVQAVVVQAVADVEDAVVLAVADVEDLVEQMGPEVQLKIVKVLLAQLPPRHLPLAS